MKFPHNPDTTTLPTGSEETVILGGGERSHPGDKLTACIDELLANYGEQHMLGHLSSPHFKMAIAILRVLRQRVIAEALAQPAPTTSDSTKLRRSAALDELGALDGELLG